MRKHRRHSFFETTALGGQMKDEVRSEINVTPLVDVMLVLLIIFMVVTPLLQGAGMAVDLPQATEPDKVPEVPSQETVSVRADGAVFLGKTLLSEKSMGQAFIDLYRQKPDAEMVVKGDRKVQYRKVREVMKLLNEAGYKNVGLIATKQKAGG